MALLGAHSAPLGMRFYTGKMFPEKYREYQSGARIGYGGTTPSRPA
jgi:glucose/arabinose dehydrogenase